ncbi:hypothetical protein [Polyangium fumosum]|uniref:DMT family transporter n=1 Tax=Polyangium fumosum TaxID=889272 RepID=A0A4U1JFB4_9BACT|nr:hypothetical protein [Polyangium fumosum]TKD09924.1 hypothetical protein E8A74_09945 [Polyangium fumosum]
MTDARPAHDARIWLYAFGYFACYWPYSALTKLASQGRIAGMTRAVSGFELLPVTTIASLVGMLVFLSWRGLFRYATHRTVLGRVIPVPTRWTFLSGVATAVIIATTTLAYTFDGVSIVLMMLLMRGGVLVLAPFVDAGSGRRVRMVSWIALGLSLASLAVTLADGARYDMTWVASVDVAAYLASYFVRLRFMSHLAKSEDPRDTYRYFVEEQMVATPVVVFLLVVGAVIGKGAALEELRAGFLSLGGTGALLPAIAIGLLSQGTGVFGALILLDGRENAFCVPVNRASSVLAGVLASATLALLGLGQATPMSEVAGAGLVLSAIVVLAWPTLTARRRAGPASTARPAG